MKLFYFLRNLKKSFSKYKNSIIVSVSKENILHNLHTYQRRYEGIAFAPVLKSNAYGHGLIEVAKILEGEKEIPFFIVDSLYESRILKSHNISKDILIIGFTPKDNILNFNSSRFIFSIISLQELKNLSQVIKKPTRIHLKIDTGMHRQGVMIEDIDEAIKILKENKNILLEGIFSHLGDADNEDESFSISQIDIWREIVERFKNNFSNIKHFHLAATSGIPFNELGFGSVARLGIGLFGFDNSNYTDLDLRGALRVESLISSIRTIKRGESVGYGRTFILENDSTLATVPVGYFEGVDRRLSNVGSFKIADQFCKIRGRVNMNITSIDISKIKGLKLEDKVIIISENKKDLNSVSNIAKLVNTVPYDILVHINSSLKRRVIESFAEN
jgi:alanine racemase